MQTSKEMSKEMAEFCRKSVLQQPKRSITQSGIGKTVLQGIVAALLSIASPTGTSYAHSRGCPWIVGG